MLPKTQRDELFHRHINLARDRAHRKSRTCREPIEDLIQLASIGLMKAIDRFDPKTGNAFSSFAIPYIDGEMQHFLRGQWQQVKIPRTALEGKSKVRRVGEQFAKLGRKLEPCQVASGLGVKPAQWDEWSRIGGSLTVSLDEMIFEPSAQVADGEESEQEMLMKNLEKLPPKQKLFVVERFFNNRTDEQIAKQLQLTPQFVKAQLKLAIAKLKIAMREDA